MRTTIKQAAFPHSTVSREWQIISPTRFGDAIIQRSIDRRYPSLHVAFHCHFAVWRRTNRACRRRDIVAPSLSGFKIASVIRSPDGAPYRVSDIRSRRSAIPSTAPQAELLVVAFHCRLAALRSRRSAIGIVGRSTGSASRAPFIKIASPDRLAAFLVSRSIKIESFGDAILSTN